MTADEAPEFPPGVDPAADDMLGRALHSGWRLDPEWRRWSTYDNPVLFAWTYFYEQLSSPETGGKVSLAEHHLRFAEIGRSWMRPGGHRVAEVVPRGSAKTTWFAKILAVWALAHGHRGFALLLSDSEAQAVVHLDDVRYWLTRSSESGKRLLRADFPGLVPPRGARNNSAMLVTASGGRYAARGMDSKSLGLASGARRPDLMILDDIEPDEARYGHGVKAARLASLTQKILPMNERAAVVLNGTVTAHGSLMHDVVRAAAGEVPENWIVDERFECHHTPAILVGDDGEECSFWPQRYPLEYLRSIRGTRNYALNFAGSPPLPGARLWSESTFRYLSAPVAVHRRALFIDPSKAGASLRRRHDYTAIVRAARAIGRREVVIEWAQHRRESYASTSARIAEQVRLHPDITDVYCEVNALGSDEALRSVIKVPPGVRLHAVHATRPKDVRIKDALALYEAGLVWHAVRLAELEDQQMRWPDVEHDDLADCVAMATEILAQG